eukprot:gnl/MRDRNA2_/MRDRNA2_114808_c0_seq1.p1 gnl/MRDRNA2_/MRDRNA2_114808_c0~~gnl/MRDRNA2_/MRDRNA2_114808_c0_seq1.p1  ORF type:complete len:633 (+),score=92.19 gnl/MRDRNA2_/MRDRNA2_114808_c0_seq1:146-1900(+)
MEDLTSHSCEEQFDSCEEVACGLCVTDSQLDLATFKTQRCDGGGPASHDSKCCLMFHHRFDRRRPPSMGYFPEPCEHEFLQEDGDGAAMVEDDRVICPAGDKCSKCHNVVELLYHPKVYKRRLCMDKANCPRGVLCAFAHSAEELEQHATVYNKEELVKPTDNFYIYRYKTLWCPLPGVHDWDSCVYAHTKRDIRRTPHAGYGTRRCPDWEKGLAAEPKEGPPLPYDACCPRGAGCHMAHGVKEVLYHPDVYRMRLCSGAEQCRGARRQCCAFAHSSKDLRPTVKTTRNTKMNTDIVEKEQPQFFFPLTFASFKDVRTPSNFTGPRTPSPECQHKDVPEGSGTRTEQALQHALQPEPFSFQGIDDSQLQTYNDMISVQNQYIYTANQQQQSWVDDCCIASPGSPCVAVPISPATPQFSSPCQWKYVYDAAGNLHMWPEAQSQAFGPVPEHGVMDLNPKPAPPKMLNPKLTLGNLYDGDLRSDSMGSWASSTMAPSTGGYSSSCTDDLRSNSLGSWGSSSSSPVTANAVTSHESTLLRPNSLVQDSAQHREERQLGKSISAKFAQIRAKLKPKQKSSAAPVRRFI